MDATKLPLPSYGRYVFGGQLREIKMNDARNNDHLVRWDTIIDGAQYQVYNVLSTPIDKLSPQEANILRCKALDTLSKFEPNSFIAAIDNYVGVSA